MVKIDVDGPFGDVTFSDDPIKIVTELSVAIARIYAGIKAQYGLPPAETFKALIMSLGDPQNPTWGKDLPTVVISVPRRKEKGGTPTDQS